MQSTEIAPDLLNSFESHLVRASAGQRFANYIIDFVVFIIVLFIVAVIVGVVSPETLNAYVDDDSASSGLVDRLLTIIFYGTYMGIVEAVFKGKSLGKLITGTRAVNLDGTRISAGTAFARGFSRAVPFAAFSALGSPCNPWQDKWTKTLVINEKESELASR